MSSLADDQICAFETVFADGPRLISAVDALGRVARGESGPPLDPPGLNYDQINNRAQSRLRTPR